MILGKSLASRTNQVILALIFCALTLALWKIIPHPVIAVIIGLVPIAIIVTLRAPLIMVIFFVAFSFFRLHEAIDPLFPLRLPLLLSLGALSGLAWGLFITRSIKPWWSKEMTLLMLFVGIVIVGILFTANKPEAIGYFKDIYWKVILMTFAISWLLEKFSSFRVLTRIITISGIIVASKTVYNRINEIGLVDGTRVTVGRDIGSILGDPNDLALVLMFPTAFSVALSLTKGVPKFWRILGVICLLLIVPSIIMTESRGGLLGVLGVLGVFAYRLLKSKILFFTGGALAAILLFAVAGVDRSDQTVAESGLDHSAQGRLHAWEAAVSMALSNPITGVGISTFYYNYYAHTPVWDGKPHSVHSTWFGVLAETGFIGLTIFGLFLFRLFKNAKITLEFAEKNRSKCGVDFIVSAQAAFAGLIGTSISATFLTQGFSWPFYILAGVIMAGHHLIEPIVRNADQATCSLGLRDANQTAKTL